MKKVIKTKKPSKALKSIASDIVKAAPKLKNSKPSSKLSPIMQDLIKVRESLGMSRSDLAKKMGRHITQVLAMETGKTEMPTIPLLEVYARAVGCELVILLKKTGKK